MGPIFFLFSYKPDIDENESLTVIPRIKVIKTCYKYGDGRWTAIFFFSDEAHFKLSGYVNKQNYRIWGSVHLDLLVRTCDWLK